MSFGSSIFDSKSSHFWTLIWLEEVTCSCLSPLLVSELLCWPVKTTVRLFTLCKPSVFTLRVKNRFMWEGIELCALFLSPSRLNTESFCSWDSGLGDCFSFMILLNTESFGCAWLFTLQNIEGLGFWLLPILVKMDGRFFEVDGCNLSNTEGFVGGWAFSSSLSSTSSVEICWTTYHLLLHPVDILIGYDDV